MTFLHQLGENLSHRGSQKLDQKWEFVGHNQEFRLSPKIGGRTSKDGNLEVLACVDSSPETFLVPKAILFRKRNVKPADTPGDGLAWIYHSSECKA